MEEKKFVFGVPVTDYNFTGREEESRRLLADFNGGINVILMSPRRIGKTSLVKHVLEKVDKGNILVVYMDIFGCKTEYEIYNKFAEAVLEQTANKSDKWLEEAKDFLYRLPPKISFSPDPTSEFGISLGITPKTHTPEQILSLPQKIAERKGKHILVCIDEFQQVGELANSKQVQARMRGVWQLQQSVSYCLFGSKHHLMGSIFLNRSMPFFQFGDLINLQKIPQNTWVKYIVKHFEEGNRTISDTLANKICEFVDCYSSYVQQLSWIIYSQTPENSNVSDKQVAEGCNDLLAVNDALFMQQIEPLSEYQMNFIRAIASNVHTDFTLEKVRTEYHLGSYSNITRLTSALLKLDIIEKRRDGIFLTDPVFEKWFRKKMIYTK